MAVVYIAVGSNIEPEQNIRRALRMLSESTRITAISTFYRTDPLGCPTAPPFLNGVLRLETDIEPHELKFGLLRKVEETLGRVRTEDKNAPRTLDLDIILYDSLVIRKSDLMIPDPEITERAFIAVPLAELDSDLILPESGLAIADIAGALADSSMDPLPEFSQALREEILYEH